MIYFRYIQITSLDLVNCTVSMKGYGEKFDMSKHTQGTEIKAITMHEMKINEEGEQKEIYVLVDI